MTARIREFLKQRQRRRTLPRGRPRCRPRQLSVLRQGAAGHQSLLRGQSQSGAGNPEAARRARLLLRCGLDHRDSTPCSPPAPRPSASPTATPSRKRARSQRAFALGVTLFAVDCEAEVEKVARAAPGSRVICRIHCDGTGAEWPLSRKFGCEPDYATDILELAHRLGLVAHGISFHVGSQQHNVEAWDRALASTAADLPRLRRARHRAVHGQSRRRLPGAAMCARRRSSNPTAKRSSARCAGISATPCRRPSSSPGAGSSAMPA